MTKGWGLPGLFLLGFSCFLFHKLEHGFDFVTLGIQRVVGRRNEKVQTFNFRFR